MTLTCKTVAQRLSLVALLIVFGSATPLRAQNTDAESEPSVTTAECIAAFEDFDMDEFEGIDLTAEQSSAVDQAVEQLDEQSEAVMTPEQLSALESVDDRFSAAFMAILTPAQQQQEEAGTLDIDALSAEQTEALDDLAVEFFEETDDLWEFSTEQAERLDGYEKEYERAVVAVLTPQQQAQYSLNQFELNYPDLTRLELAAEQRQQIMEVDEQFMAQGLLSEETLEEDDLDQLEEEFENQLMSILTDAQQQQLEDIWAQQEGAPEQCW